MNFRHEHGRRYHGFKNGTYLVPNDEEELQRLDLQHAQWLLTLDGALSIAPIPSPAPSGWRILDIGCGTGVWAVDFAKENPGTSILGVDLSLLQPEDVPPNCKFQVHDIETDWSYDQPFNYIHGRFLSMGIRSWERVFQQSFANLEPGGWAEYQEAELTFPLDQTTENSNPQMVALSNDVHAAASQIHVDVRQAHGWKQAMERVGFINHRVVQTRWPLGEWSSDAKEQAIGRMNRLNMLNAIEGLSLGYLVRVRGDPPDEVRARVDRVKKEMNDPSIHMYMSLFIHIGQKPS